MKLGRIVALTALTCLFAQVNAQDSKQDAPRAKMPSFTEPEMEADNRRHMMAYERKKRADQKTAKKKACKGKPEVCNTEKK